MSEGIRLGGCRRTPLGSYLKALGVLRLVSEQVDGEARGWWDGQSFRLSSRLDEAGLVEFFLRAYAPTPIVAPWNAGSGFHAGDDQSGLRALVESQEERFAPFRAALRVIQECVVFADEGESLAHVLDAIGPEGAAKDQNELRAAIPEENRAHVSLRTLGEDKRYSKAARKVLTEYKKACRTAEWKLSTVTNCRNRLSDTAMEWVDAVAVLAGKKGFEFPPILGTGGNEGRLDYTNNFMLRLHEVLLGQAPKNGAGLIRHALFGDSITGLAGGATGKFDPGRAGGANQGEGVDSGDYPTNPWSHILVMEGLVVWASGISKRSQPGASARTSSPFTVLPKAVGYGSRAGQDERKSKAEIWTPIWERPARLEEVRSLIREGRVELWGRPVKDGLDFTQAATSLGVDRGLGGFERSSLLERRGQGYFVALPVGFIRIRENNRAGLVERLRRQLTPVEWMENPPAMIESLMRVIDEGVFQYLLREGSLEAVKILRALGQLDRRLSLKPKGMRAPLWGLDPEWIQVSDDGSPEHRIAVALASLQRIGKVGGLRANLCPVKPGQPWSWEDGKGQECWEGRTLAARLSSVLRRRMMDVARFGEDGSALAGRARAGVGDVAAYLDGRTDDAKIEELLFAFSLVDWRSARGVRRGEVGGEIVGREYALLKLLFSDMGVEGADGKPVRLEPSIVPLLGAQRIADACEVAKRRLQASGLSPLKVRYENGGDGQRLAGALLIPVMGVQGLKRLVLREEAKETKR